MRTKKAPTQEWPIRSFVLPRGVFGVFVGGTIVGFNEATSEHYALATKLFPEGVSYDDVALLECARDVFWYWLTDGTCYNYPIGAAADGPRRMPRHDMISFEALTAQQEAAAAAQMRSQADKAEQEAQVAQQQAAAEKARLDASVAIAREQQARASQLRADAQALSGGE